MQQARKQLEQIEHDLGHTYSQFDDYNGRQLRQQWNALMPVARLQEGDPLRQRAAPALEWLAQQDNFDRVQMQFDSDVQGLEDGLLARRPAHVLEQLYQAVARHEQPLPERLEARYQQRIADLHAAAANRKRNWLIGTTCSRNDCRLSNRAILVHNRRLDEIDQNATALRKLIDENKLEEAKEFLSKVKAETPSVADSTEFNDLNSRLDGLLKIDSERKQSFAFTIQSAHQASDSVTDWATLGQARSSCRTRDKLSRSGPQKDDVKQVDLQLTKLERGLQKMRMNISLQQLIKLRQRLQALETDQSNNPRDRYRVLGKCAQILIRSNQAVRM